MFDIKDIHEAMKSVQMAGHQRDDIEALLINSDDFKTLLMSICENKDGMAPLVDNMSNIGGEIRILGIKIIDSPYLPRGSVFKVFKEEKPYYLPDGPKDFADINYIRKQCWKAPWPEKLSVDNFHQDPVLDEKKDVRHSKTRKVELN